MGFKDLGMNEFVTKNHQFFRFFNFSLYCNFSLSQVLTTNFLNLKDIIEILVVENKNLKKKNYFLETSWTEHILVTPIRSNMFPHSAMPPAKLKSQGY